MSRVNHLLECVFVENPSSGELRTACIPVVISRGKVMLILICF